MCEERLLKFPRSVRVAKNCYAPTLSRRRINSAQWKTLQNEQQPNRNIQRPCLCFQGHTTTIVLPLWSVTWPSSKLWIRFTEQHVRTEDRLTNNSPMAWQDRPLGNWPSYQAEAQKHAGATHSSRACQITLAEPKGAIYPASRLPPRYQGGASHVFWKCHNQAFHVGKYEHVAHSEQGSRQQESP